MVSLFGQKGKNFQSFLPFVVKPTQIQFSIRGNLDFYINENTLRDASYVSFPTLAVVHNGPKCPSEI